MKTYIDRIGYNTYRYFYDVNIRLWTVHEVDNDGNQISHEGDYFHNKEQMLDVFSFKFTNYES